MTTPTTSRSDPERRRRRRGSTGTSPRAARRGRAGPCRSCWPSRSSSASGRSWCGAAGVPTTCCPDRSTVFAELGEHRRPSRRSGRHSHARWRGRSSASVSLCHRHGDRPRRRALPDAAGSDRLAGHRPADHAERRVVPAGHPAARAGASGHHVRRRPRCRTERRERRAQRRRPGAAGVLPARPGAGAEGWRLYRYIVIPAALPSYVGGLNQGWAFAWRSLMAGELLVVIPGRRRSGQPAGVRPGVR